MGWLQQIRYDIAQPKSTRKGDSIPKAAVIIPGGHSVAHVLGFQWLWIDALCIVQDSATEKISEINKMDQVYRSSALTLYAVVGNSADTGLSVKRDPQLVKMCMLELRTTLSGKTMTGTNNVMIPDGSQDYKPLFQRGWVLQEEILAPKGLIFGSKQIAFRCICGSCDEMRPSVRYPAETLNDTSSEAKVGWPRYYDNYRFDVDDFALLRLRLLEKDPLPALIEELRDNHFSHWYYLVIEYFSRSLAFSSDALPALAGLANALAKRHGWAYVLGLWKEDIQRGLLWYVRDERFPQVNESRASEERTQAGRGRHVLEVPNEVHNFGHPSSSSDMPSWSWASVWGQGVWVTFLPELDDHDDVPHEGA